MLIVRWRRAERILCVVVEPAAFADLAADPKHEALSWLRQQVAPRTARLVRIWNKENLRQTIDVPIARGLEWPQPVPPPEWGSQEVGEPSA